MNSLVTTFTVAFLASLLLTIVVRRIAIHFGVIDYPDGKRKLHKRPVALWGGVAVYCALVLGLMIAGGGSFGAGDTLSELSAVLIAAAGIVCFSGAVDDCRCLSARFKLALQVVSVMPIVAFGHWIDRIVVFGCPIELGWLGIPITIAWLVGCINALNLLDGMDGLASVVGLVTATMMGVIAHSMGNDHVAVIAVVLVGSLAGFLVHNLPPASIFLGDSGSMVIGLVLGVLGMQGAMKTSATLAITIPAVVMTLPMFDTVLALVRRRLTGKRFDCADRGHIHHRLLDRGFTQWQALCVLGALCLAAGGAATAATIFRSDALACVSALALVSLAVRLQLFGNHELALAKLAVARGLAAAAHRLGSPVVGRLSAERSRLPGMSFDEAWGILVAEAKAWNVSRLELTVSSENDNPRRHQWSDAPEAQQTPPHWSLAMSLHQSDGRFCELRGGGSGPLEPELASSAGLARALKTFAMYFTDHFDQIPELMVTSDSQADPDADLGGHTKAA